MSLPRRKKVHGVTVERLPVGRWLEALSRLEEAPERLLRELFPGKSTGGAVASLAALDAEELPAVLSRLLTACPATLVESVCEIVGLDCGLVSDKLAPVELAEVLEAFWDLNDLSGFFRAARRLAARVRSRDRSI